MLSLGLVIAVGGLIVPFALELEGLRLLDLRVVAVIYSIDLAIGSLIGVFVSAIGHEDTGLNPPHGRPASDRLG